MTIDYLKKATSAPKAIDPKTTEAVQRILLDIKDNGRAAVEQCARELDGWEGPIVVSDDVFAKAGRQLSQGMKDDIAFAHSRVKDFANRQRDSLQEFEVELINGLITGQKLIPVNTAGCYIPGGRYAHAASAIMSICTAKVAGVQNIVASTPAQQEIGIHPAILYTMQCCGVDMALALGGAQGIGAMAYGLYAPRPADIIVGPGNSFVSEAKRLLFGQVGIDVLAGPTETAIIADESADADIVASDLAGQAEHGPDSPVWLFTTSRALGQSVIEKMPGVIAGLPNIAREAAHAAWRDFGEVIYAPNREEICKISDQYAPEHLQVLAEDLDWWLARLTNYGSLFLGEETTVAYGDKCSGPNHILPTKGAARYSGGLSVGKFIKTVTYQRLNRLASREVGQVAARISRMEGMEGHARTADIRLKKYYPHESFELGILNDHSR
jgi:sulfopropanediol 3-dehydrogenase